MSQNFSSKTNQLGVAKGGTLLGARSHIISVCVFFLLLALTFVLQVRSGAYDSDFGGHADEAAHVVTGLMVRDYLAGPVWEGTHPMRYAEDYYERFPKVAIGHYPPGFYLVEGLWLLPSRSKTAVLLLPVFLTAFAGWVMFEAGRQLMGFTGAFAAAVLFPLMHLVQTYTAIVMSDVLLVVWCLLAAMAFSRFLATGTARWSLAFGLLATAAILTKGSGLLLALIPPFAIVFSGRFRTLLAVKLWLAPIPVLLFAVPWLVMTTKITSEGMSEAPLSEYLLNAIPYYLTESINVLGFVLIILVALAFVTAVKRIRRKKGLPETEAVLWALAIAVVVFYCAVPSGLDGRYLLPLIPPVIILALLSLSHLAGNLREQYPALSGKWLVLAGALAVGFEMSRPAIKVYAGPTQAVERLLDESDEPLNLLVCSDARGEGALIAAAALLAPDRVVVQRGTKLLSTSDWLGREYTETFSNEEEMLELLDRSGITHVVIDQSVPETDVWLHQTSMHEAIHSRPGKFKIVEKVLARRRSLKSVITIAKFSN